MIQRILEQIQAFWERQTSTQKVMLVSGTLIFLVISGVLISWATRTTYGVAFSGLSEEDAGKIVEQLAANNTPYQIRGTGTILVPTDQVYEIRLQMANQGLPQGSSVGYELFSGNMLGMTEFTQQINYQRALEGELQRTIGSIEAIEAVRVHIVTPEKTLLSEDQAPTTASITIQERTGKRLDATQVRSITYLVANAVEGLDADNVTVVDTNGTLLASGSGEDGIAGSLSQVDSRRSAELGAAEEIQMRIKTLLDSTIGPNKSVVRVNVTLDWTERQISSEIFDPTPAAVRSEQTLSESYSTDGEVVGGIPGATSNLPENYVGETSGEDSGLVYTRTEQTNNYEISRTESFETIYPGAINVLSVSVLVDGVTDEEQLTILEDAISAAAGVNLDRGDVISVQSLVFDTTFIDQQLEDLSASRRSDWIIRGVEIGAVLLVFFFVLWYVFRLLRNLRMASVEVWEPVMQTVGKTALPRQHGASLPDSLADPYADEEGFDDEDFFDEDLGEIEEFEEEYFEEEVEALPVPDLSRFQKQEAPSAEEEQMQRVVTRLAEENPASVAEIIQLWLTEDKDSSG
ncbi:MAG: flagellar M-ring protein FliF [Anaerolineaceae bacterium]|nr:flagellar M-ring protein FliF [Anaerolineaceae bacterium]